MRFPFSTRMLLIICAICLTRQGVAQVDFFNAYELSGGPLCTEDVFLVLELAAPNSCVTYEGSIASVNGFNVNITINSTYNPPPPDCFFFYYVFNDTLNLGKLPPGTYTANVTDPGFIFNFEVYSTGNCVETDVINLGKACPGVAQVCGCNGVTYQNACTAFYKNGVTSWTNGACANACVSNPASVSITGGNAPVCAGGSTTLMATGAGSTSPYTYVWSNGSTGSTINISPIVTTTYTVTVTSQAGCTATAMRTVTVLPAISVANINTTNLSGSFTISGGLSQQNGSNYSTVTMTLQGNPGVTATLTTAPFTHGETVNFVCPQAGAYTLTVTDANGCSGTASVSVIDNGGGYNGPGLPAGDCWTWQNPLPQGNGLNDVFFVDELTGWAVGESGTILKTVDGGNTWTTQTSGTVTTLNGVHFIDMQNGLVVGSSGTILKTIDGGITWAAQTSGTGHRLYSIQLVDALTGWAVGNGGTILNTVNGGNNWTKQASGITNDLQSAYFTDTQTGWAVGYSGIILKTIDGGNIWTDQISGTVDNLRSVHFADSQTGWVVGNGGTILKTVNGGNNWTEQVSGTTSWLFGVYFEDVQTGWAVGTGSTILNTVNGGNNWTEQVSETIYTLTSVHFTDTQTGWAVGIGSTILKTVNGGNNWTEQVSGTTNWLTGVYFEDVQTGWTLGDGGTTLKTVNGGSTWTAQSSGTTNGLNSIYFSDAQTGWAVGNEGTILKTVNGGNDWIAQSSGTTNALNSIYFSDAQTGWAVGNEGSILKTVNGGNNWTAQSSGTTSWLLGVFFADAQTGWAVGGEGTILKTFDGGNNWVTTASGTSNTLYIVHFVDAQMGWVVGNEGTILKTVNGGNNWIAEVSGTNNALFSIHFVDAQTGWAVGEDGTILKTVNSGNDWIAEVSGTTRWLNGVYFADVQTGWAVGRFGTILKYTPSIPTCIPAIPLHTQTDIPTTTSISWPEAVGCEDGYRLQLSTTPGGADLLDTTLIGIVTSFQPTNPLPAGTTIYVRISPFNDLGAASGCPEFSFTTAGCTQIPQANFSQTVQQKTATFTNTSLDADTYSWDFGDGNTSTQPNPMHTYATAGTYVVQLIVENNCDADTLTRVVNTAPDAGFNISLISDCTFLAWNESSPNSTFFTWHFPGGIPFTSTLQNPLVLYGTAGDYPVMLIAQNSVGNDTIVQTLQVPVTTAPSINFNSSPQGLTVTFNAVSSNADSYSWSFGDGNSSFEANPIHTYAAAGTYSVCLTGENDCGSTELCQQLTIQSACPPTAQFFIEDRCITGPNTYTLRFSASCTGYMNINSVESNVGTPDVLPPPIDEGEITGIPFNVPVNVTVNLDAFYQLEAVTCPYTHTFSAFSGTQQSVSSDNGNTVCSSTTLSVPNVPGATFQWRLNGVSIGGANSATYLATTPGTYDVTWTEAGSCTNYSSTITLVSPPLVCNNINVPCNAPDTSPDYLLNQLNISNAFPDAYPCPGFNLTYSDQEIPQPCNSGLTQIIERSWTAADGLGNSVSCLQVISQPAPELSDVVMPPDYDPSDVPAYACSENADFSPAWLESQGLQGFPRVFGFSSGCNINWEFNDDLVDLMNGGFVINRTWTANDFCSGTTSQHTQLIQYSIPPLPVLEVTEGCIGGTLTLEETSGTAGQWSWSGPGGFTASGNPATRNNLISGHAGIYGVTVTNGQGCTAESSVNVNVGNQLTVSVTGSGPACAENNITLTASNGSSWIWQGPDNFSANIQNPTINNLSNLQAGMYSVTVSDGSGCTGAGTYQLTVTDFDVAVTSTEVNCLFNLVCTPSGNAGGPLRYDWADLPGADDPANRNALPSGSYSLTVTDQASGCTVTFSTNLTAAAIQLSPAITPATSCTAPNGAIQLNMQGTIGTPQFSWNTGAATQNLQNIPPGVYTVTVTNGNGCTATAQASVNGPTSFTASAVPTAATSCTAPNGSISVSLNGTPATPANFLWNTGATTQNLQNIPPGSYSVTVTDAAGCSATAQATVSGPTSFTVSAVQTAATSCTAPNGSISVSLNGSPIAPTGFIWNTGATSQNLQNLPPGMYSVTVTDAAGCSATAQATVTGPAPLIFNIGVTMGSSCTIANGALNLNVQSGAPPYSYLWNTGATSEDLSNIPPGDYTVTVTDGNLCTATQTSTVENNSAATLSSSQSQNICPGDSVALGNVFYKTPGVYQQTLVSWLGCDSVVTLNLSFKNPGSLVAENDSFFVFNTLDESLLDVLFNDVLGSNDYLLGILNQPQNGEATVKDNEALGYQIGQADFAGIEVIRYTICSSVCTSVCDTAVALVIVTEDAAETFKKNSSNVLTPVIQDGINDLFDPIFVMEKLGYPINEANSSLDIFNRWGDLVVSKQTADVRWNGMSNSQPVPQGTYYYIFRADIGQAKPVVVVGALTVLEQ